MIELVVLLLGILLLCIFIYYYTTPSNNVTEPFASLGNGEYLSACPAGYKTFYTSNGDINCCNGDIVANRCVGIQCTLNGKGTHDMPQCVDATLRAHKEKGARSCPKSMTTYFEDRTTPSAIVKGCTNGQLNATLTGPKTATQPMCKIYATEELNTNSMDSCFNQKEMEEFVCSDKKHCTKTLIQTKGKPVKVQVSLTDPQNNTYVGTTRKSLQRFYDATKPQWRETGIDLSKSHLVAEVLQEVYIDRTMEASSMQMNP
jgi:hypothetical protein